MEPAPLQAALEAQFFAHVESLGFIRDRRQEPRIVCFRRKTENAMQIVAVIWGTRGRPGFLVQFTEAPLSGIDYSGKHLSADEIFPGNFALLRGWLIPERGKRWFRLAPAWRRLISGQRDDANPLAQRLLELFPEITAWWENKAKGAHLIILPPAPPRPVPSHAPVFGCPVKPSVFQRFFAKDVVWTIQLLGMAVVIDLVMAIQGSDWKQMFGMVFVGAAIGFIVSWFFFKILWHVRVWINGGPFHRDDLVQIIAGDYAGQIAAVYEEWPSRNQVRVDLGESECIEVKDVFSYVQLLKVKSAPQPTESPVLESRRT
jgi:hypothetical protein